MELWRRRFRRPATTTFGGHQYPDNHTDATRFADSYRISDPVHHGDSDCDHNATDRHDGATDTNAGSNRSRPHRRAESSPTD